MNLPLRDKGDGSATPCGCGNNEPPLLPHISAYEPYGPNGVRQMGGDQAGVHEDSLIAHACAGLFLNIEYLYHLASVCSPDTFILWR